MTDTTVNCFISSFIKMTILFASIVVGILFGFSIVFILIISLLFYFVITVFNSLEDNIHGKKLSSEGKHIEDSY